MNYYEVSPVGALRRNVAVLTYVSELIIRPGQMVSIPVGKKNMIGVVVKKAQKPGFECKKILKVLFDTSLPEHLVKLHSWLSTYYSTGAGIVWQTMLPSGLSKNHRDKKITDTKAARKRTHILLNNDQQSALRQILNRQNKTSLLHGITGSGKTEIYKNLVCDTIERDLSSIILVPEISLTSQVVAEFKNEFNTVVVTHSKMTSVERFVVWKGVLEAEKPLVVIGPRSALFLPVKNLGLIVIDECHEPGYKQGLSPKYNALRAAAVLAKETDSRLILGSATPLVADFYLAKQQGAVIELNKLAAKNAIKPKITLLDMTKRENRRGDSVFSPILLKKITDTLKAKHQVLIFHNRRGSASSTLCENCGWSATCSRCFLPLTLHADNFVSKCHLCGYQEKTPTNCPTCNSTGIIHKGVGTKRIEEELKRLFPDAHIARFDGDNKKNDGVHEKYQALYDGTVDIIVGTQTIAKGLDLPNLRLVGIPQADTGLSLPDFSARERTFQLISQAVGRVGRNQHQTEVVVQSFQANSPVVKFGINQDYHGFYESEIQERKRGHFPPFSYLLKLTNSYKTEKTAISTAKKLAQEIISDFPDVFVLGPAPAFYERQRDQYRWQIVVRAKNRKTLEEIVKKVPPTTYWQTELDPNSLL
ncbi:primosomal protein N' [Candidatus Saccharibacteria bacterium]|nr:primosomal protein N' [Candidatus Saccharibacteria bacterium]